SYLRHLEQTVAPVTRLSILVGLKTVIAALAPEHSWGWLQKICNRIHMTAKPTSNKGSRVRRTPEIFAAAVGALELLPSCLLTMAETITYRDALMLALLSVRPLRAKNFAELELERHVLSAGGNWQL